MNRFNQYFNFLSLQSERYFIVNENTNVFLLAIK